MAHATVTSKGQITIPRSVRQALGLRAGSRVGFRIAGRRHVQMQSETASVRELKGICKTTKRAVVSLAQMRQAIRKRHVLK